jgi:hypothetical protein
MGKVDVLQQGRNIDNATGLELKFEKDSGEVELTDRVHIEQKSASGKASVTFNAGQPGTTIKFNTKPDDDKSQD